MLVIVQLICSMNVRYARNKKYRTKKYPGDSCRVAGSLPPLGSTAHTEVLLSSSEAVPPQELAIHCVNPEPFEQPPRAQASTTSSSTHKQRQTTLTPQAESLSVDTSSLSDIETLSNWLESLRAQKLVRTRYRVQELKGSIPLQVPRDPVQGLLHDCLEDFRKDVGIPADYKKFFLHVQCEVGCIRITVKGKTAEQSARSFCKARKHCLWHIYESFKSFKEEGYGGTMCVFIEVEPYEGVSTGRADFCNSVQW
jgi:hypothetical protein